MERACVSTLRTNEAARKLYESAGFEAANEWLEMAQGETNAAARQAERGTAQEARPGQSRPTVEEGRTRCISEEITSGNAERRS